MTKEGEHYVYANASVVCGPVQLAEGTTDVLANPSVVVEVLSRGTEAYDRGEKWLGYGGLSSLSDYLLVSQGTARVEHYQRQLDGSWSYRVYGPGDRIALLTGGRIDVNEVYRGAFDLTGE